MDNGILVCLDGKTGTEVYRKRLGARTNSSPVASGGPIYLSDIEGNTYVVRSGRHFELSGDEQSRRTNQGFAGDAGKNSSTEPTRTSTRLRNKQVPGGPGGE
jgi:outer membrane protein assembly factor BamB